MTARDLQAAIVDDLKKMFTSSLYKTPTDEYAPPAVYAQNLPKRQSEEDPDPFPYVIVRLDSGEIPDPTNPQKVAVLLLIGAYDDAPENQGHMAVMEIMEKIQEHYQNTPNLADLSHRQMARLDTETPSNWALQDEESYPYFFGAMNLTWNIAAPRTKWSDLV